MSGQPTVFRFRVTYAKGTQEALKALSDADLMGFALPRRYGGLNFPSSAYIVESEAPANTAPPASSGGASTTPPVL